MKATTKDKTCKINDTYRKARPNERRRMIARDALKQIKAEKFIAASGNWAEVFDGNGKEPDNDAPLQPLLLKPITHCECCGVGAVFLSYVRLANHANYGDSYDFNRIQKATGWPADNLRMIEAAFEIGHGYINPRNDIELTDMEQSSADWGADISPYNMGDGPERRLVAILNNIAASKDGLFNPHGY